MLYLNALLGLGTALAPVLVAVFVGLGFWWGLPLVAALLLAGLIASACGCRWRWPASRPAAARSRRRPAVRAFWVFAAFALLYGVVETINGNWATIYMTSDLGSSGDRSRRSR